MSYTFNWSLKYLLCVIGNRYIRFSSRIRKALSKKVEMKFLPKVSFVCDKSFDYAEKIEKLIKQNR